MRPAGATQRLLCLCVLPTVLASLSGCHGGQVKLRVVEEVESYEWRHPIPPGTMARPARELLYHIDAPLGYARGYSRPLEGFAFNARVRWNVTVRPLGDELSRLAEQHNRAEITLVEFEGRQRELLTALQRLAVLRGELDDALRDYSRARETSGADPAEPRADRQAEAVLERATSVMDRLVIQNVRGGPAASRREGDKP